VTDTIRTSFKKRATAIAVASCLSFAPWLAEAASLGKITVLSGLGQPLRAEIEISASRAELAGMTARLAGSAAFKEAGIDYASALLDLRFDIGKRSNGAPVVKVSSTKPVNEPFMDMLVELSWPSGPLLKEYTFLLDPPEVAARAAARQAAATDARVVETVRGAGAAPSATGSAAATASRAAPEARKTQESGTHLVQQGETLRRIAGETKHDGVTLEQMLVGLYKKNPDAFIGNNVNRLKAGAILSIPDKAAVAAIPAAEARQIYVTQAEDWNAYRQKLASATAQGKASSDAAAPQAAEGKVTARVEEKPTAADQAKDKVKVSSTEMPAKGVSGGKSAVGEEELIAKDKALKEAQDRLALLEKNVSELQKLVDMKTQRLAELQQQASGQKEEAKPVAPAEPPKAVEAPKEPAPVAAEPAKPVEEPKPVEPPKVVEAPKPAAPVEPPKPATPPAPEPGLLDDPLPLIGGGGILALLAGYFLLRRRRSEPEPDFTTAIPAPSSLGPNSVFRMTGGQSVDTGNVPLQTGDFSQTGPGTIDTDEVDPVAEADVYMAYGRDAQAEEILIEALRKDPHRTAIHVKLLEIYSNRKSVKQFDTLASELYAQTGGVGDEWEKAAALGAALDPENPLYTTGRGTPAVAGDVVAPTPGAVVDAKSTVVLPGELGQMAAAAAVGAAALVAEQPTLEPIAIPVESAEGDMAQTVVSNIDDNALNFDLGGAGPAFAPEVTQIGNVVDEMEMPQIEAIDFDLGGIPQEALAATETTPQVLPTDTLVMGATDGESNFTETFIGLEAPAGMQEGSLGADAGTIDFELGDIAPDTQTLVNPAVLHEVASGELGTATIVNSDSRDAEYNVNLSESVFIGDPLPVPEFDMTSINLDLGATQVAGLTHDVSTEDSAADLGADDVGTKLALAKAYEEMGDHDQARELLQEVIAEGSGDLVDQAREIIGRLRG